MRDLDELFEALPKSASRARQRRAACDRLAKWHGIPKGHELSEEEQRHVLAALERWLRGTPASVAASGGEEAAVKNRKRASASTARPDADADSAQYRLVG